VASDDVKHGDDATRRQRGERRHVDHGEPRRPPVICRL